MYLSKAAVSNTSFEVQAKKKSTLTPYFYAEVFKRSQVLLLFHRFRNEQKITTMPEIFAFFEKRKKNMYKTLYTPCLCIPNPVRAMQTRPIGNARTELGREKNL